MAEAIGSGSVDERQHVVGDAVDGKTPGAEALLMAAEWWRKWEAYVASGDLALNPGPVDNSAIIDETMPILADGEGGPALRRTGLSEQYDFELITRRSWEFLVQRYGVHDRSRVPMARRVVSYPAANSAEVKLQCELEIDPPRFSVYFALENGMPSQVPDTGDVCVELSKHLSTTESMAVVQRALDRARGTLQTRPRARRLWFLPPNAPDRTRSTPPRHGRHAVSAQSTWMLLHHSPSVILGHLLEGMLYRVPLVGGSGQSPGSSPRDGLSNSLSRLPSLNLIAANAPLPPPVATSCATLPSLMLETRVAPRAPTPRPVELQPYTFHTYVSYINVDHA
jgi:hypothetical protein